MIKAEELRIGNLIYVNGIAEVRGVTRGGVWIRNKAFCIMDWKPIALNEEWLFKLGSRQLPHGYFIGKLKFTYEKNELSEFVRFHYSGKVAYLQYVHQIQNLYYALTDEELTIKLLRDDKV